MSSSDPRQKLLALLVVHLLALGLLTPIVLGGGALAASTNDAAFHFDEDSTGVKATDYLNDNDGEIAGSTKPGVDATGYENPNAGDWGQVEAFDFGANSDDNGDEQVIVPVDYGSGNELTAAAWIKTGDEEDHGGAILAQREDTGSKGWQLWLNTNEELVAIVDDGNKKATVNTNTNLADNDWHHVAMTVGGGSVTVYINGSEAKSKSYDGSLTSKSTTEFDKTYIGVVDGEAKDEFDGFIDEPVILPRALDGSEIDYLNHTNRIDESAPTFDSATKNTDTKIDVTIGDDFDVQESSISKSDFSLSDGSISSLETSETNGGSDTTVTLTLSSAVDADNVDVTLDGSISDQASHTVSSGTKTATNMDGLAPTIDSASKVDDTTIDVDLSDGGAGFDVSTIESGDFSLDTGTIASIDKSSISDGDTGTQTVTLNLDSAVDDDTVTVSLQSDGIDDLNGNTQTSGSASATGMDGVAPTIDGASKVDDTTIDVDLSDGGVGIDKSSIGSGDFTLDSGTIASIDKSGVTDGATGTQTVTLNLDSAVDADTVTVDLQSDGIDDTNGNTQTSGSADATNMDGVAPTLDDASKVDDTTIDVDLSDGGAGFDVSTIEPGDFSLDTGTIASIDKSSIADGDTGTQTVIINLDAAVNVDTVTVSLQSNGIDDLNGNTQTSGSADVPKMDGVQDPPDPPDLDFSLEVNKTKRRSLSDTDSDGDAITYTITDPPGFGDASFDGTTLVYDAPSSSGTASLTYEADDGKGNTATANVTVEITPPPEATDSTDPKATIITCCTDVTVDDSTLFSALSSSDNLGIEEYAWDFDGDGEVDTALGKTSHSYDAPGTYVVNLTVTDVNGNTDTALHEMSVTAPGRPLDFAPGVLVNDTTIAGANESTIPVGYNVTGESRSDVQLSLVNTTSGETLATKTGLAADRGTANLTLPGGSVWNDFTGEARLLDASGTQLASDTANVTVTATLVADAGPDRNATTRSAVTLNASGSGPTRTIEEYTWDFDGDGETDATATSPTVNHTYNTTGTFEATLTVTATDGETATDSVNVTVEKGLSPTLALELNPMFQGGTSNLGIYPDRTGPAQRPGVAWRAEHPAGSSAVTRDPGTIAAEGMVFTATSAPRGEGDSASENSTGDGGALIAYDSAGERVWTLDISNPPSFTNRHGITSHPKAHFDNPLTYMNGTIYTSTANGSVWAIDAGTGSIEWQRTFKRDGGKTAETAHVTPYNGSVYVAANYHGLVRLDAETGDTEWKQSHEHDNPRWLAVSDGRLYSSRTVWAPDVSQKLKVRSLSDGSVIAENVLDRRKLATPAVANGTIYARSSGEVAAIDADTGNDVWADSVAEGRFINEGFVYDDGTLYVPTEYSPSPRGSTPEEPTGTVIAYDAATGERKWTTTTAPGDGSALRLVDGTLYTAVNNQTKPEGSYYASTITQEFFAIDAASGEVHWNVGMDNTTTGNPVIAGGQVYAQYEKSTPKAGLSREELQKREGQSSPSGLLALGKPSMQVSAVDLSAGNETVTVTVEASLRATSLDAEVTGPVSKTLSLSDFTENSSGSGYTYTTTVPLVEERPVTYDATVTATDADGNTDSGSGTTTLTPPVTEYSPLELTPSFQGGTSNLGIYPDRSGAKSEPTLAYETYITPGWGLQTILYADGTVLAPVGMQDGPGMLKALDPSTGEELWSYTLEESSSSYRQRTIRGDSLSVMNGTVLAKRSDNVLLAIDLETGEKQWSKSWDAGEDAFRDRKQFNQVVPYNGTVYLGGGADDLTALDAETGDTEWSKALMSSDRASAAWLVINQDTVAIKMRGERASGSKVFGFDATTGDKQYEWSAGRTVAANAPTFVNGTLYSTGRPAESRSRKVGVFAYDADTGDVRWKHMFDAKMPREGFAYSDGTLYVSAIERTSIWDDDEETGSVVAFDATTGEREWTTETQDGTGGPVQLADGVLYTWARNTSAWYSDDWLTQYGREPNYYALDAASGEKLWTKGEGEIMESPWNVRGLQIGNGQLYAATSRSLGTGADSINELRLTAFGPSGISVQNVTMTGEGRDLTVAVETTQQPSSLTATIGGAESATLELSEFTQNPTTSGYRYTANYTGRAYGIYNVSVVARGQSLAADGTASAEVRQPTRLNVTDAATVYQVGEDPVGVVESLELTGSDRTTLSEATVTVGQPDSTDGAGTRSRDRLGFDGRTASKHDLRGNYNPTEGTLTISGEGSLDDYEAVLQTVTFETRTKAEQPANRTVTFSADNQSASVPVAVTNADRQPPRADAGGDISVKEGNAAVFDGRKSVDNRDIANYTWAFGDGNTSSEVKTVHVYDEPGVYEATLTVTDEANNSDTATVQVRVENVTLIAKTGLGTNVSVRAGETVKLNALASAASEGITSYAWDVGADGSIESRNPVQQVSYGQPGTYETELTITDMAGNEASTTTTITVTDSTPPTARLGEPRRTVSEGEAVTFNGSESTDVAGIERYEWDFDGDGTVDALGRAVSHTYTEPGTYEATLTVTDAGENTANTTQILEVGDTTPPHPAVPERLTATQGETVVLNASGSTDNGEIASYEWDIDGDGETERTGETTTATFERAGEVPVELTVTDAAGNNATQTTTVAVEDTTPPNLVLSVDTRRTSGLTASFNASNSTDNVEIAVIQWDFDGDGTVDTQGEQAQYTYASAGSQTATVNVTDTSGNTATETASVVLFNNSVLSPSVSATNDSVAVGRTLVLNASASRSSAGIASYEWDVGADGSVERTGETATVTFDEAGTQTIALTVTDRTNQSETVTHSVKVRDVTPPTPPALPSKVTVDQGESVSVGVTDSADDGDIASYEWDFNRDGKTDATGPDPDFAYEEAGTYTATLTVRDEAGNQNTTTLSVQVNDTTPPEVVVPERVPANQSEPVVLNASGSTDNLGIASYEWDTDADGESEKTGRTATATFKRAGEVPVTVTVTDTAGNSANRTMTVDVRDSTPPNVVVSTNTNRSSGLTAAFDASNSTDNDEIASYEWDFDGDGTVDATGQAATHTYASAGTRTVAVNVTDASGNSATATTSVVLFNDSVLSPSASASNDSVAVGRTLVLNASASRASAGIQSYEWDVGANGSVEQTGETATVTFDEAGTQTIALTVTDRTNQSAATNHTVDVRDVTPPTPPALPGRVSVDQGESVSVTVSDSTDDGEIARYEWDFDRDGRTDATGPDPEFAYENAGEYTATLTVRDEAGNQNTTTLSVRVNDTTPPEVVVPERVPANQSEPVVLNASGSTDNGEIASYEWDTDGDGDVEKTGRTATATFERVGEVPVELTVTDAAGNSANQTLTVEVRDSTPPNVVVTTNTRQTSGMTAAFDASNSTDNGEVASIEWDFDRDGTVDATGGTVQHTFTEAGTRTVAVNVTDASGNSATETTSVVLFNNSVLSPSASVTNDSVGAGRPLVLNASASRASAGIDSYEWDVGADGSVDRTGETATVTFEKPGTQTIALTVTDTTNQSATTNHTVDVRDVTPPTPPAVPTPVTVDQGESVSVDITNSTDDSDVASYEWDFDRDGETDATGPDPEFAYEEAGAYTATLTVRDEAGNEATATVSVRVNDTTPPEATAGQNRSTMQGERVQLTANATDNDEIAEYAWDTDDDGETEATSPTATVAFEEIGAHEVGLTVTDVAGNSVTDTVTVAVTDGTPPVADVSHTPETRSGSAVTFTAANSTDNVGVERYEWAFGDGSTATGETVTHTYENDGRYTVEVTVSDAANNTATDTVTVTVVDGSMLVADAGKSQIETTQNATLTFDATGSESAVPITAYEWDFDGDGAVEATGPAPTHTFTSAGTQTVTLRVRNDAGTVARDTVDVAVADAKAPTSVAAASKSVVAEETPVTLHATKSTDNTAIASYEWDVNGDGTVDAQGKSVQHAYADPGTYEVVLTVTDEAGNADQEELTVLVTDETAPTVELDAASNVTADRQVTFDASGSTDETNITAYRWDVDGDGTVETRGERVTHTYERGGSYNASVTVRDQAGNTATRSVQIDVQDALLVASAGPDREVGPATELTFDGTDSRAELGIERYEWTFGDGAATVGPVASHSYVAEGTYNVTLTVTDTAGNTATDMATVTVGDTEAPTADAGSDRTVSGSEQLTMRADGSSDDSGVTGYTWNLGDGTRITTDRPAVTYRYNNPGTYPVTLTVSDAAGNTDTDSLTVEVRPENETGDSDGVLRLGSSAGDRDNRTDDSDTGTEDGDDGRDDSDGTNGTDASGSGGGLSVVVQSGTVAGADEGSDGVETLRSRDIVVENAPTNSQLSMQLTDGEGPSTGGANTTQDTIVAERLDIQTTTGGSFDLNVTTQQVTRNATDLTLQAFSPENRQFVEETGARPAGLLLVEHSIPDSEIANVTHHFRVEKSHLNATGVGPQSVTLYREQPGGQNPLPTTYTGSTDDYYHYRAASPGLSVFTIGSSTPVFDVDAKSIAADELAVGEQFTVELSATNVGSANGTYDAALLADGEPVDSASVEIAVNETETIQFTHTFTEAGNHSLALGNSSIELTDIEVSEGAAQTNGTNTNGTNTTDATTTPTDDGGSGLLWMVLGILVVVLVGIVAVVVWTRQNETESTEKTG